MTNAEGERERRAGETLAAALEKTLGRNTRRHGIANSGAAHAQAARWLRALGPTLAIVDASTQIRMDGQRGIETQLRDLLADRLTPPDEWANETLIDLANAAGDITGDVAGAVHQCADAIASNAMGGREALHRAESLREGLCDRDFTIECTASLTRVRALAAMDDTVLREAFGPWGWTKTSVFAWAARIAVSAAPEEVLRTGREAIPQFVAKRQAAHLGVAAPERTAVHRAACAWRFCNATPPLVALAAIGASAHDRGDTDARDAGAAAAQTQRIVDPGAVAKAIARARGQARTAIGRAARRGVGRWWGGDEHTGAAIAERLRQIRARRENPLRRRPTLELHAGTSAPGWECGDDGAHRGASVEWRAALHIKDAALAAGAQLLLEQGMGEGLSAGQNNCATCAGVAGLCADALIVEIGAAPTLRVVTSQTRSDYPREQRADEAARDEIRAAREVHAERKGRMRANKTANAGKTIRRQARENAQENRE